MEREGNFQKTMGKFPYVFFYFSLYLVALNIEWPYSARSLVL